MAYKDLREFMAILERRGLLVRVKAEVDPEWEINGITNKIICEGVASGKGQTVVFENVKNHKVPVICNLFGTLKHLAQALGMDTADDREIRKEWLDRIEHPIAAKSVKTGPCKENTMIGENINLNNIFPPVLWHKGDGGPYIGTLGLVITKDPETGVQNTGIYRMMVKTKNETGLYMCPGKHGHQHLQKWARLYPGKPMPVAVAIGTEPCYLLVSGIRLSHPPDEGAYAGGLRKEGLELVKCETCDLEVPATSEIVLEGEVYPEELEPDGPFGEYYGYLGGVTMVNVFHIKTITHRNNPIFQGMRCGYPSESHFAWARQAGYLVYARLRNINGVIDVHMPLSGYYFKVILSIRKLWPGHVNQVIHAVWAEPEFGHFFKNVVVVDEGVDVHNPEHVEWAIANHVQPDRDILIAPRCPEEGLDVSQPYSKRYWTTKWGIDATLPTEEYESEGTEPPLLCDDPDIKAKVEARWEKYGINI